MMATKRQYNNGPDQIISCENITTTNPNGAVKLRLSKDEKYEPISVPSALMRTAKLYPKRLAFCHKEEDLWKGRTYKEFLSEVQTCAKAFLKLGLERYHSVCIIGNNSPEWVISNVAAIFAGGIATSIYVLNSTEECFHILENSKANIVVVEDEIQLIKIRSIKSKLAHLKAIIQYAGTPKDSNVLSWKDLIKVGEKESDEQLNRTLKSIAINECCSLIYKSGKPGKPKGIMLTHDNLIWSSEILAEILKVEDVDEKIVSYLPLNRIAAQIFDIYMPITRGCSVGIADKYAIQDGILDTLLDVQPTKFTAVPKIWEKLYDFVSEQVYNAIMIKSFFFGWARIFASAYHTEITNGKEMNSWGYLLFSYVYEKMKFKVGLINCTATTTGEAPISKSLKEFFTSMDMPLQEWYGCAEATGVITLNSFKPANYETVGKPINTKIEAKLHEITGQEHKELCVKGRNVFMGYLNDNDNTIATVDKDGWLHTGDTAKIDSTGYYTLTGKLKEMITTLGGEIILPVPIEQRVMQEIPDLSNVVLVGDKKKHLSILVTLRTEEDDFGKPTDVLLGSVQKWLTSLGCHSKTVTEVLNEGPSPKLLEALKEGIDKANLHAGSNAQKVEKVAILPADFSTITGELGPTLKIRRKVIQEKYKNIINKLYI